MLRDVVRTPTRLFIFQTALGWLCISLATLICFQFRLHLDVTGFVFLCVVVAQARLGDFRSAALVALAAAGCLDFFFTDPLFSFSVSNPLDLVALAAFLLSALIITQLVSEVRKEKADSDLQRLVLKRLHTLAGQLMALPPDSLDYDETIELFRSVFGLQAACIFEAEQCQTYAAGDSSHLLQEQTRKAGADESSLDDRLNHVSLRCLHGASKTLGAIGFEGLENPELAADALAALAVATIERMRAFQRASHAVATAQTEIFRGAVLDALAHEFKVPLATILTASEGIRESGPLHPAQVELAKTVEGEASRLAHLTSRLLRMAWLDREEVRPQMELIDLVSFLGGLVRHYSHPTGRQISFVCSEERAEALVDSELLRLAFTQLLDNACKYSPSGSSIIASFTLNRDRAAVRVWNSGTYVAPQDQERIFERFYRGADAQRVAPGSGLGLHVARKIAVAHGGDLHLEAGRADEGTAFRLTLPIPRSNITNGLAAQHVADCR